MTSPTDRIRLWGVGQLTGGAERAANLEQAAARVERAAALGCELVALPENTTYMGPEGDKHLAAEPIDGESVRTLAGLARAHGIWVLLGSMVERSADPVRPHNTSVLLGPDGEVRATYRKIHLFDVDVAGDRSYRESDRVSGGPPAPVTADVDGLRVGLTICFDLRFPWLYRALADAGAEALFIPAAFTVPTGRDHWEVLIRARAIETQSYVLAPAQQGTHPTGRQTYGRSLIVDPWGTVLATVPDGGDVAVAPIDPSRARDLRERMPMRSRQP
jgi:predicted amidohydrolase